MNHRFSTSILFVFSRVFQFYPTYIKWPLGNSFLQLFMILTVFFTLMYRIQVSCKLKLSDVITEGRPPCKIWLLRERLLIIMDSFCLKFCIKYGLRWFHLFRVINVFYRYALVFVLVHGCTSGVEVDVVDVVAVVVLTAGIGFRVNWAVRLGAIFKTVSTMLLSFAVLQFFPIFLVLFSALLPNNTQNNNKK